MLDMESDYAPHELAVAERNLEREAAAANAETRGE